jgi:hypothetical protein
VGTCEHGVAEAELNIGNVSAAIYNNGNLFWPGPNSQYEVPKGSGLKSHFSDYLVFGGMVDGELRMVSSSFGPFELWPGRIPDDGSPPDSCTAQDRFYEILYDDLENAFQNRHVIEEWPAQDGAPYLNLDGSPGYTPDAGDLPSIRGDQYIWWAMNDLGGPHDYSETPPLGVDVLSEAWAFDVEGDIGNTTFFRQTIVNRSQSVIQEMYVGRFADVDLGAAFDDYVGSDSSLSLAYFYNADDDDEGSVGYGSAPPAFGFTTLEAHHSKGGLPTDTGADPSAFMTSVMAPSKSSSRYEPGNGADFYWFLKGYWNDGVPMREGNYGQGDSGPITHYAYSGDPVAREYWTQINHDGTGQSQAPNDKRATAAYGPFDLAPGDSVSFTWAYVWARGNDHLDSVSRLKSITAYLHDVKDTLLAPREPMPVFIDGNPPEEPQYPFWVDEPWPNPASERLSLSYSLSLDGPVTVKIIDRLGRVRLIQEFSTSNGPDLINLDISSLSPGAYSVSVESWSHHASHSFVVLR